MQNLSKKHLKQIYRRRNGFGGATVMLSKFFRAAPNNRDEILTYANKDELANQVVTRTTADPEFRHFIVLTIRAITLMRTLEEENND